MSGAHTISSAVQRARDDRGVALVAYLCAGHPTKDRFRASLTEAAEVADVVEVGVPFSDPMADGMTIQGASRTALAQGVTLPWILDELRDACRDLAAPIVLMGYLNPFVRFGLDCLAAAAHDAGVSGFIVPDLPHEESAAIRDALSASGVALINMVTPVTPEARMRTLAETTGGFLYAVTTTGVTGGAQSSVRSDPLAYLRSLRDLGDAPVCAGFGIRTREQVEALRGVCDGAIVGSALIEAIDRGESPRAFLTGLRE